MTYACHSTMHAMCTQLTLLACMLRSNVLDESEIESHPILQEEWTLGYLFNYVKSLCTDAEERDAHISKELFRTTMSDKSFNQPKNDKARKCLEWAMNIQSLMETARP
tara:strand:- start:962 stop:1285 length:324 start_codon:yes stop_codon:yes gene_type:complete